MDFKNRNFLFLVLGLSLAILAILFYKSIDFSPSLEEKVVFDDGSSYTQQEIDEFFAMGDEYSWESGETTGLDENSGLIYTSCSLPSDENLQHNLLYEAWLEYYSQEEPQGPPPQGPQSPAPKPTDPLPPDGEGLFPDDCVWRAIIRAKAEKFKDTWTYEDYMKILDIAKKLGLFRSSATGGVGTVTPGGPRDFPEAFKKRFDELMSYIDNEALGLGGGGGGRGDAKDTLLVITPGIFTQSNKAFLKAASDRGDGMILNFGCTGANKPGQLNGHAVNVPKSGVTPNPNCKSTKFKTKQPDGEVTVDVNGKVTSSSGVDVPIPGGCGLGSDTILNAIIIISNSGQTGPPSPNPLPLPSPPFNTNNLQTGR